MTSTGGGPPCGHKRATRSTRSYSTAGCGYCRCDCNEVAPVDTPNNISVELVPSNSPSPAQVELFQSAGSTSDHHSPGQPASAVKVAFAPTQCSRLPDDTEEQTKTMPPERQADEVKSVTLQVSKLVRANLSENKVPLRGYFLGWKDVLWARKATEAESHREKKVRDAAAAVATVEYTEQRLKGAIHHVRGLHKGPKGNTFKAKAAALKTAAI